MMDKNCMYCEENQTLKDLMIYVCNIGEHKLYLFKNQCYAGRCIVAFKSHVRCMHEMSEADCAEYFVAVQKAGKAVQKLFNPAQINYATFGDKAGHVHCHIVPKYENGLDFGGMFGMNPDPKVMLSDAEYLEIAKKIKAAL